MAYLFISSDDGFELTPSKSADAALLQRSLSEHSALSDLGSLTSASGGGFVFEIEPHDVSVFTPGPALEELIGLASSAGYRVSGEAWGTYYDDVETVESFVIEDGRLLIEEFQNGDI